MTALLTTKDHQCNGGTGAAHAAQDRPANCLRVPWRRRDGLELLTDQLGALDAWLMMLRGRDDLARQQTDRLGRLSREVRLDQSRRADVLEGERAALLARADGQHSDLVPPARRVPLRAVVVHRHRWVRDTLTAQLAARDVQVSASLDCGADVIAAVVLEHPDLLIVEDLLPMVSGIDIVRYARQLAPAMIIGVQTQNLSAAVTATASGADAVFTRSTPLAQIAQELTGRLTCA